MNLNISPNSSKEEIFEQIAAELNTLGFNVVKQDQTRPWGGFFVIDETQAPAFASTYFPHLEMSDIQITNKLSGATTSQLTAATALTRAGAFNSVNYGTMTINPSVLANLGSTEKVIVTTGAPANTALTGGDILTVPSIFVALAGSGQDANFARYDAVNGLREHNVTPVTTLVATAATNVADVTVADTVGSAPAEIVDVAALRMAANVTSFDGSQLLRINRGGLIFMVPPPLH